MSFGSDARAFHPRLGQNSALDNLLWILEANDIRGSTRMMSAGIAAYASSMRRRSELGHLSRRAIAAATNPSALRG